MVFWGAELGFCVCLKVFLFFFVTSTCVTGLYIVENKTCSYGFIRVFLYRPLGAALLCCVLVLFYYELFVFL